MHEHDGLMPTLRWLTKEDFQGEKKKEDFEVKDNLSYYIVR